MKARVFRGVVHESAIGERFTVAAGTSIVFLEQEGIVRARFYTDKGALIDVPAAELIDVTDEEHDETSARLAALERQSWLGPPRLGPRPESDADVAARTEKTVEAIKAAVAAKAADGPPAMCTTNGKPVDEVRAGQTNETGQHDGYIVLCPDERAKGFVRPYRDAYRHAACGVVTTMGRALSETYARNPKFYGATFCCGCNRHLPVAEFVWTADGAEVGS
jgi:hypothetical protein